MDEMVVLVLLTVLVNGIFDAVVVAWLAGRRSQRALEKWIKSAAEGDEEAAETLGKLAIFFMGWLTSAQIRTGRKIKVATGEEGADGKPEYTETDEILTPIDLFGRRMAEYMFQKMKGSAGGAKTQLLNSLAGGDAETGMGLSPAAMRALLRGNPAPAIMEKGLPFLQQKLKKKESDTVTGGGDGW